MPGTSLAPALLLTTVGGMMVYSSIKGISITGALAGEQGDTIDPHGAKLATGKMNDALAGGTDAAPLKGDLAQGGNWTAPAGGAHGFKGPRSALLNTIAGVAQQNFHLTITATTNGTHVTGSDHYAGRAFDCGGSETNMQAFSRYVLNNYGGQIKQMIHNPGFAVNNGQTVSPLFFSAVWAGHADHVHLAM